MMNQLDAAAIAAIQDQIRDETEKLSRLLFDQIGAMQKLRDDLTRWQPRPSDLRHFGGKAETITAGTPYTVKFPITADFYLHSIGGTPATVSSVSTVAVSVLVNGAQIVKVDCRSFKNEYVLCLVIPGPANITISFDLSGGSETVNTFFNGWERRP